MKVLSVDDSKVIRMIIRNAAEILGVEVLEAMNGKEALTSLNANDDICLILLDQNMPVMTGNECLKQIRANSQWNHIPIMMVTSEGGASAAQEAIQNGANDYLNKPFAQEDLITKILPYINN